MEEQLGAVELGVTVELGEKATAPRRIRYTDMALNHLERPGAVMHPDHGSRLFPLFFGHVNIFGEDEFTLLEGIPGEQHRPLRAPASLRSTVPRF